MTSIRILKTGGRLLLELSVFILSLCILIPILLIVLGAFKDRKEAAQLHLSLPSHWVFTNFETLLSNGSFLNALSQSLIYTIVGVLASVLINAICAYTLARRTGRLPALIYYVFITGLILPPFIITQIRVMQDLHLMDTFIGVELLYICGTIPFSVFLITGFIKNIPIVLDEAAFVDGGSAFRVFLSIVLPLLKPVAVTVGVFNAIGIWNDFQTPLYFLRSHSLYPITMWLYKSVSQHSTNWDVTFTSMTIALLPMALVYAVAQKYIVDGLTAGAVKS